MNKKFTDKIGEYFSTRREIKFAYLFGSQAKGNAGRLSDVDIGVYIDERTDEYKRFDIRLELIGEAGRLLGNDNIDLVILNDVDIFLAYQVIYFGKIIYSKDELRRIRYEATILSLYFDQQYYYERHAELTIERIAREGIL
ncbi:MAG: type VII toxin-antitoxin system MntA family adenylyltransferase antitoxin [Candidatus Omnitrophota bacterium]